VTKTDVLRQNNAVDITAGTDLGLRNFVEGMYCKYLETF